MFVSNHTREPASGTAAIRSGMVMATADGMVLALRGDGSPLPGWPVATNLLPGLDPANPKNHLRAPAYGAGGVGTDFHVSIVGSVAVGDVDGDGEPEVIAADLE